MTAQTVIDAIARQFPFEATSDQQRAMERLGTFIFGFRQASMFVLKGYAGTGKTTLVRALVQALPEFRVRTVLMAPTGRAAKVMAGYAKQNAFTIHKLIYITQTDPFGLRRLAPAPNRHRNTVFIVDEASMIGDQSNGLGSRRLLDDLFDFVQRGFQCKLILIGDQAQLPPVGGSESPALNIEYLESSYALEVYHDQLTEVVRQSQTSGILHNATRLRQMMALDQIPMVLFKLKPFLDISRVDSQDLEDRLQEAYSYAERDDVVVITRSNKRALRFNQEIRYRILGFDNELNGGDRIMVVRNNYFYGPDESQESFLANGDILDVQRLRGEEQIHDLRFAQASLCLSDRPESSTFEAKIILDGLLSESAGPSAEEQRQLYESVERDYADITSKAKRLTAIRNDPFYQALHVKYAYAMTAHKAQGGQWHTVFIDGFFAQEEWTPDDLRWLYTALTRATHRVFLLNFKDDWFE